MGEKKNIRVKADIAGPFWFAGWLFTIGYAHLPFMKAVWALVLWPYYLGSSVSG